MYITRIKMVTKSAYKKIKNFKLKTNAPEWKSTAEKFYKIISRFSKNFN